MILFPDQEEALEAVRDRLRAIKPNGRKPRVILQAPCGFGKTAVSAFIAKSAYERGNSNWFICHRDYLVEQASKTFANVGIPHSYLAAGRQLDPSLITQIGMVASLKSRVGKLNAPKVAIWDECNHINSKTWSAQMEAMPDTIHIGLTATPCRSDKQGLDAYFDDMVLGPSVADLIAKGRLSDFHYFAPSKPDLSKIHIRMGDYVQSELDVEMTKAKIVGDIVGSYKKHANNLRAVYFATSIDASRRYAQAFNDAGIPATHIDSDCSAQERKQAAVDMAMGRIKVITNYNIFAYGLDLAAAADMPVTVEAVGLCRPTKSFPLLVQMAMRCMRAKDYPGIILDHGGNLDEHQWLPDDFVDWSLKGAKRNETVGTFQCQGCGATLRRGIGLCGFCGADNSQRISEIKARKEAEHIEGELARVEREARERQLEKVKADEKLRRIIAINACKSMDDFYKLGKKLGYDEPKNWAFVQWKIRGKKIMAKEARRLRG